MIISTIRLQEEHPMARSTTSWPLPYCDLNLDSSAGENGYLVKASQGLGPPDLIAVVEGFDSAGIPIMGSVAEKREIALRIALIPGIGQSYSSLRDDLYKFMSRAVVISFINGSMTLAKTSGFIRKFETLHFSAQPEIQLTIECDEGELYSPTVTNIPLSTLNTLTPTIGYEDGTAPTGLSLQFTVTAGHSNFSITNHNKMWYVGDVDVSNAFTVTYAFLTNDVITINTNPKEKKINLLRSAVNYDLAGYLNSGAVWPKLYPGVNAFDWTLASSWMTLNSASYVSKFWGV